jgi:PiT family inorganic phosphate transporter
VANDVILSLVVVTALAFDFTNGFHDTGNAMATSIATGALPPRVAVALSGVLNLVGAFLSFSVAATIASGLVVTGLVTPTVVFAGLAGGILWNLATWFLGIPSSSSHALIGGVIGSTLAAAGGHAVKWHGLVQKVIIPAVMSPVIAGVIAAIGTYWVYRLTRSVNNRARSHGFRIGQIGSASMVSLAHGTNDAQKTMGIITLALIANGSLSTGHKAPIWVIVSCAVAISLGTYLGGWRVIRTLGKGLVEIEAPQGMAAESASAAVILLSSHFGYSLSTTHVATGSILGGRSDGHRVAVDVAVGRDRGCARLLCGARHRRGGRRGHHVRGAGGLRRCVLRQVAGEQGQPRQRERRMDRLGGASEARRRSRIGLRETR